MTETIEGQAVEIGHDMAVRHEQAPVTLFGTDDPALVIQKATRMADALMNVVRSKGLSKRIGPKDYLLVEAWTCLGSLVGVFPRTVWSRELDNGYEARVEAVTQSGAVVGAAEASCTRDEKNWANRDAYALRSMAQTRAMGKALRMPLGFIAVLAGFEATPAEEMPDDSGATPRSRGRTTKAAVAPNVAPENSAAGDVLVPEGPHKGKTLQQVWMENPGYVSGIAKGAKDKAIRQAAQLFLESKQQPLTDEDVPF